jgi:hypothetical protein
MPYYRLEAAKSFPITSPPTRAFFKLVCHCLRRIGLHSRHIGLCSLLKATCRAAASSAMPPGEGALARPRAVAHAGHAILKNAVALWPAYPSAVYQA